MAAKLLTEAQAQQLIREIIVWDELYEAGYLTEAGLWDKIKGAMSRGAESAKYQLGKAGSMEKGGTILGRGKASKEASAELQAIMDKAENATLKGFFDKLKEEHPEYPNQESQKDFVNVLQQIGTFFASLHAAAGKKEGEEGYLPCQIANAIIDDLKKAVQKTLDYDLSDVYKHFKENKDLEGVLVDEGFMDRVKGAVKGFKDAGAPAGGQDAPEEKSSARLTGKDSSTMKGLKSNLLPALLALGGVSAGMAHILVNQPWFLKLIMKQAANPKTIPGAMGKILNVKPGEGPTQMLGRLLQANPGHYGADVPVATMLQDMSGAGISPEHLAKLGRNPTSWLQNWNQMMASPEAGSQTLGQFFGPDAIQGLAWDPTAAGAGLEIGKTAAKTVASGGGAAAASAAGGVAAVSWATGVLGIGLLASAAAVKAIRIKGLKSSRAQGLNDLMNTLNPVDCDEGPGTDDCKDKPGTKLDPETGECVCEEPGTIWDDKKGECVKAKPAPGPRIGLINLDNPETDVYYSRRRAPKYRDADAATFKKAQTAGAIGNPSKTAGVLDKGEYQDSYPQQPSVKNPKTKDYKDFVKRLRGRAKEADPYFSVDGSVISDASKALKGVRFRGKNQALLKLTKFLVTRFAKSKAKADKRVFRRATKKYIDAPLSRKARALLYNVYADYGLVTPTGGGLPPEDTGRGPTRRRKKASSPPEEERPSRYDVNQFQEGQKRPTLQELNENKTIQRWKHLAGIKSE